MSTKPEKNWDKGPVQELAETEFTEAQAFSTARSGPDTCCYIGINTVTFAATLIEVYVTRGSGA